MDRGRLRGSELRIRARSPRGPDVEVCVLPVEEDRVGLDFEVGEARRVGDELLVGVEVNQWEGRASEH